MPSLAAPRADLSVSYFSIMNTPKSISNGRRAATLALFAALAAMPSVYAASGSWTNLASGNWSTGPWTGGVPNAATETATFSQNWAGQTITVDTAFTVGQILATDTTANGGLTISGGTLTLANGVNSPVISTGTNNAFSESAANRFKISSVLDGTNGFERQGNGYLDLSGVTNVFTGTVKLTAPASGGGSFTVINSDANLGNSVNVISVALSGQPVGFYNDASAGNFTLNSARTITTSGTGAFWVKNKAGANMTIAGVISGTAQLRKNDSGTLTLSGANTFTGGTFLDGGTLALSGGDNRLLSTSTVTFNAASTLDVGSTSQTLGGLGLLGAGQTNTISGAGGTLIVNFAANTTWSTTVTGTTVNMAGLSNLTVNRTAGDFGINSTGLNVVNTVNLARTGTNTINATNVRFGGGGSNVAGQNVLLGLGQNNNINASGEFVIGFFQGSGNVSFQSGLTNPSLTVRGAGGIGAAPVMSVGSTNSGNQGSTGILNLTNGSLDAQATDFYVARHFAGSSGTSSTGTVTMPAGSVVATTLNLAAKTGATSGAPTLNGTFNQSGGTVTATTVNLGLNTNAESPNLIANYNLTGGTLFATTIQGSGATYGASTVRNLTINGGTLQNLAGGNLSVDGLATTATGRINVIAGASGATFNADATRSITLGANTVLSGSGALTKSGAGSLTFASGPTHTYSGAFGINAGTVFVNASLASSAVTIGGGSLGGSGTVGAITLNSGSLAPGTGIGTLSGSSFTWNNGGSLVFELSGLTSSDRLSLSGAFTKGTGIGFTFDFGGGGLDGGSYTLTSFGGTTFSQSDFVATNLGSGLVGSFVLGANDLTLNVSAIPEPSTFAALAGLGVLGCVSLRRRRRVV